MNSLENVSATKIKRVFAPVLLRGHRAFGRRWFDERTMVLSAHCGDLMVRLSCSRDQLRDFSEDVPDPYDLGWLVQPPRFAAQHTECWEHPVLDSILKVSHAASLDETRPHLCGVQVQYGEVAASDGHRLARVRIPTLKGAAVKLPLRVVAVLDAANKLGTFDPFQFSTSEAPSTAGKGQWCCLESGVLSVMWWGPPGANYFPPTSEHFDQKTGWVVEVFVNNVKDRLLVNSEARVDLGDLLWSRIDARPKGVPGVDRRYLKDLLDALSPTKFTVSGESELDPVIFTQDDFQEVIMPMRRV